MSEIKIIGRISKGLSEFLHDSVKFYLMLGLRHTEILQLLNMVDDTIISLHHIM